MLTSTEEISSTDDYGLEDPVPFTDTDQAQRAGMRSPVDHATMQLTDYIMLNREVRTAAIVFDPANFPSGNKVQLATNDQWNEHAQAVSDPIADILTGADAMLVKPTHMCMGSAVWIQFRTHPVIVKAVHGNDGDTGIVTRHQVADLFELEEVLVGETFLNTAKHGQAATLGRVWGNHCLLYHISPIADARGGLTFGATFQYQSRVAGTINDPHIGLRGGTRVRVGESVKEKIVAARAAYLIQDAI